MGKALPRTVTPILSALRNFLLERSHITPLRFGDYYAPRTLPQPDLLAGPHSKLADNYYYSHDGRREASPPLVIASLNKLIQAKSDKAVQKVTTPPTPGNVYKWA